MFFAAILQGNAALPYQAPPRNPTPLGNAAVIRDASHLMFDHLKARILLMVKKQEPSDTKPMVRTIGRASFVSNDTTQYHGGQHATRYVAIF
jgi:hypothetical protein